MEEFFKEYQFLGYLIVLLGSFVEGESVVLTASAFSYKGYFSLPLLMVISFLGTLFADQLLFYIGRFYGPNLIERYPTLKEKSKRVFELLHKYNVGFILSFRFIYGIRIASPLIIGASGISIKRFTILNVIAAFIWSVLSCLVGYTIGYFAADFVEEMIMKILHLEKMALGILGAIVVVVFGIIYIKKKFFSSKPKNTN